MKPAIIDDDHWIWRWQYGTPDDFAFLHRVAEPFEVGDKEACERHTLTTVCGESGEFEVPGVFSRMGAPRCPTCCEIVKIPIGDGAPWNESSEWRVA